MRVTRTKRGGEDTGEGKENRTRGGEGGRKDTIKKRY